MEKSDQNNYKIRSGELVFEFDNTKSKITFPGGGSIGDTAYYASNTDMILKPGVGGYAGLVNDENTNYARVSDNDFTIGTDFPKNTYHWIFDKFGIMQLPGPICLKIYKNEESRDKEIPIPYSGMMIYLVRVGVQVYGETKWNTIFGSGD